MRLRTGRRVLHDVEAAGRPADSDGSADNPEQRRVSGQQPKIESAAEPQGHQEADVVQKSIADRPVAGEQDAQAESNGGAFTVAQVEDLEG